MFALVRVQLSNRVNTQTVKRYKSMRYIHDIKLGMLQVRDNEISLRKWFDGTAHLRSCARKREHCC